MSLHFWTRFNRNVCSLATGVRVSRVSPPNKVRLFVRECPVSAALARWLTPALASWRLTSGVSKQNASPGTRILSFSVVLHPSPNKPASHFDWQLVPFAAVFNYRLVENWKRSAFVGHLKAPRKPAAAANNLTISAICEKVMVYHKGPYKSNNSRCNNCCVLDIT